jgi:hypothetical protein
LRLLELEIHNIRGICDLTLKLDGKNLVIWGSNGSGKSAVVDSIDFLLTGKISRLTGKGTGDLSLEKHGTHIDHNPSEATVRGVISIVNYPTPIEIKRCIATPGVLEYSDQKAKPYIEPALSIAARGQYVLTRREILKYITAEPGNRAIDIQTILDLREIEDIRKNLVKIQNQFEKELNGSKKALTIANGEMNALIGINKFETQPIIDWINGQRKILGATAITELKSDKVKSKITAPVFQQKQTISTTQLKNDIENLKHFQTEDSLTNLIEADRELRCTLQTIQTNPELTLSLKMLNLVQLGIRLIDVNGKCPLCNVAWKPSELNEYLTQRLNQAAAAQQYQDSIGNKSSLILRAVSTTLASINSVMAAAEAINVIDDMLKLKPWRDNMQTIIDLLLNPIEKYVISEYFPQGLGMLLLNPNISSVLDHIYTTSETIFPKPTPELEAWDLLTKLEERLSSFEKTFSICIRESLFLDRSTKLLDTFVTSRDNILQSLYDSIRDRFVELYRAIHGLDELTFSAEIIPDEASLDFTVDFYGKGKHPPHALHSEGHQDSMGLCLYLALTEKLTKKYIDLIMLDDVVMSVDMDHRKQVCHVLSESFPTNQFVITTHDRTWANQLRSANIVDSKGMVQFYNWHVSTGPQIDYQSDVWGRIESDLSKNDISSASGKLRQNAEQFFAMVCDELQAPVIYKLNNSYDLGNLLNGAIGQYRNLLKKGKNAAQSWGQTEEFQKFQELESIIKTIYERTNAEKWPLNSAIHYNSWANFSKADFQPILDAFKDIYGVFVCNKCSGLLHVVNANGRPETVRCNCPQINWNLVSK